MTFLVGSLDVKPHLRGTFSRTKRAIPIKSLNVKANRSASYITFELVESPPRGCPHLLKVLLRVLHWDWLPLMLIPVSFIYFDVWAMGMNYFHLALIIFSLSCFHFSAFLFNDYSNYMSILNFGSGRRTHQVLEEGWLSATQIHKLALVFLVMGGVAGVPILFIGPLTLFVISFFSMMGLIGYFFVKPSIIKKMIGKYIVGLRELVVYCCFGPFLIIGLVLAMKGEVQVKHAILGLFWGGLSLTCLSMRQFQNLMYDDKMDERTLVRRLGFDRAKRLVGLQLGFNFVLFWLMYFYFFPDMKWAWSVIFFCISLVMSLYLIRKVFLIDSSLSSDRRGAYSLSIFLAIIYGFMILITFSGIV